MSGGQFGYKQYEVEDLASRMRDEIDEERKISELSEETILKFELTRDYLFNAARMLHRVDWLVSGDDGEDDFHGRWKEEGLPEPALKTRELEEK